jgi:hypothetical protein
VINSRRTYIKEAVDGNMIDYDALMHIKRLVISRYRGIEALTWDPSLGVNCLIGPGDTGKSTVLSAIGLLLAP